MGERLPIVSGREAVRKLEHAGWALVRRKGSHAGAHCGGADENGIIDLPAWRKRLGGQDSRESLMRPQDDEVVGQVRLCSNRGRPLGSDSFMPAYLPEAGRSKLERMLG